MIIIITIASLQMIMMMIAIALIASCVRIKRAHHSNVALLSDDVLPKDLCGFFDVMCWLCGVFECAMFLGTFEFPHQIIWKSKVYASVHPVSRAKYKSGLQSTIGTQCLISISIQWVN